PHGSNLGAIYLYCNDPKNPQKSGISMPFVGKDEADYQNPSYTCPSDPKLGMGVITGTRWTAASGAGQEYVIKSLKIYCGYLSTAGILTDNTNESGCLGHFSNPNTCAVNGDAVGDSPPIITAPKIFEYKAHAPVFAIHGRSGDAIDAFGLMARPARVGALYKKIPLTESNTQLMIK
ncbi:MAG: hypothetical protein ACD_73C00082G0003, partial [uncultured bacterium]